MEIKVKNIIYKIREKDDDVNKVCYVWLEERAEGIALMIDKVCVAKLTPTGRLFLPSHLPDNIGLSLDDGEQIQTI